MLTSLNDNRSLVISLAVGKLTVAALIIVAVSATSGFAGAKHRRPQIVIHPAHGVPVSPYAPYYYSVWNPRSIYSIYDHLSGGRQQCYLPSEPCENDHRVTN
jgi:ABC-type cobalt transport system substrate-binding protein